MEWISVTPDVARNDIRIFQMLLNQFQRMKIILSCILRIYNQFNPIVINQVFILFFHKPNYYIDFLDSNFMKLLYDTLNKRFSIDLKKSFWHFRINRNHTHTESSSQDDCSLRGLLFELRNRFHCWSD